MMKNKLTPTRPMPLTRSVKKIYGKSRQAPAPVRTTGPTRLTPAGPAPNSAPASHLRQRRFSSAEQRFCFRQRFVQPTGVLAAAAGVVGLAAALAAHNRRDLLDDFSGLNFRREIR